MASPYTTQSISGYNSSPPADDGSKVSMNQVNWSKHKTKLTDPIKTLSEAINTELVAAFGKIAFSGVSDKTGNYTILEADQGNLMTHSGASDITFTLLAAATAGSNWVIAFSNVGTGTTTLDGNGSETINGSTTITLPPGGSAILVCDGSNWSAIRSKSEAFPVGAIYLSTSATNPGTTLGYGTWSQIAEGRTLIGEGTSDQAFTAAATGGASTHTLTESEMPAHTHSGVPSYTLASGDTEGTSGRVTGNGTTSSTGGGSAHNNLPPYLVVYIWERTA